MAVITDQTLLHFSLITSVGPAVIEKLVQNLTFEQIDSVYNFKIKDFQKYCGVSEKIATILVAGLADKNILDKELNLINKYSIKWSTFIDNNYPISLKAIHLPPTIIYWRGNIEPLNDKAIAFVGSRACNNYGIEMVNRLVPPLVQDDWTIVSGGALGIDTAAHNITIKDNGKTYVIMGSGLLSPYPTGNIKLFEKIIDSNNGAVISSFSLMQPPAAINFPIRNRIISGLSKACVVVQAAEKSGALITANYALNQGKEVCVVPGAVTDILSMGCNKLIAQGANLITSASDITDLLGYTQKLKVSLINPNLTNLEKNINKTFINKTIKEKIISLCSEPVDFDELLLKIECEEKKLQSELFDLQMEEKIEQNFMGLWHILPFCSNSVE